jgi:hypothetical protein
MQRPWAQALALLAISVCAVYHPVFQGLILMGRDAFRVFVPDSSFLIECLRKGELPLWTPHLRLGQPFAATLYSQAFYPPRYLALLFGAAASPTALQILHAAIAFLGMFHFCGKLSASRPARLLAATAFGCSPLLAGLYPQQNVVDSAAWTGFLCAAAVDISRGRPGGTSRLAFFGAMSFLAGSPETLLWQGALALGIAATTRLAFGAVGRAAVGWALAFALSSLVAFPALEWAARSSRRAGVQSNLEWSLSWPQLLSVALPFADNPRGPYWGEDQWFLLVLFLGSAVTALAACGLWRWRRSPALAIGVLLLAALSLGAHFAPARWLLGLGPLSWFRFPAKYFVGAAFCIAALAALGLDTVAHRLRSARPSRKAAAACVAALFVCLSATPLLPKLAFRAGASAGLSWAALVWAIAAFWMCALPARPGRGRKLRRGLAALAISEIIAFQFISPLPGWLPLKEASRPSALASLLPRPFHGRISADLEPLDSASPKEGEVRRSRDALVPNRFLEEGLSALEGYGAPEPEMESAFHLSGERSVYDLASVSYFVRSGEKPFEDLQPLMTPADLPSLFRSDTAMPRAFVLHRSRIASDRETQQALRMPEQPWRATAYLSSGETLDGPCEGSSARIRLEKPNRVEVEVESCGDGYLVLSDSHYPGWVAHVDGTEVPIHRAYLALRAVRVGPGSHRLVFSYRPKSFYAGLAITTMTAATLVAAAIGSRKRMK